MKKLIVLFSIVLVSSSIVSTPPSPKIEKSKGLKALTINCVKARQQAKEKAKTRKKSEWPPDSL